MVCWQDKTEEARELTSSYSEAKGGWKVNSGSVGGSELLLSLKRLLIKPISANSSGLEAVEHAVYQSEGC